MGVPGEVNAMYRAWQEHGRLPWNDLVQPTIDLCRNGFPISKLLHDQIKKREQLLYNDTGFRYTTMLYFIKLYFMFPIFCSIY